MVYRIPVLSPRYAGISHRLTSSYNLFNDPHNRSINFIQMR